ncbi:MAG: hypothetical protein MHM6MM_004877 [Cercozoa sp. M6MM]
MMLRAEHADVDKLLEIAVRMHKYYEGRARKDAVMIEELSLRAEQGDAALHELKSLKDRMRDLTRVERDYERVTHHMEELEDENRAMASELEALQNEVEELRIENEHLENTVEDQSHKLMALSDDLDDAQGIVTDMKGRKRSRRTVRTRIRRSYRSGS